MKTRCAEDRPLRVAYVVYTFDTGGIERCVAQFVNHLDPAEFQPMVISLDRTGSAVHWITRDDVPVVELRKRPGNDPRVIRRLASVLRERRVDVVHSHNWGTLLETVFARRWSGVSRHVHTEHGQGLHADLRGVKRLVRGWATRWALSRADAVAVCAESVRRLVHARCGFPESRLHFIPNGVEACAAAGSAAGSEAIRRTLDMPDDAMVVGSVGRLVPVKDFGTLIDAVAALSRGGRNVHLVLVGDGPEAETLAARARVAGVSQRVHLVGRRENVKEWLPLFDVYVNSSRSEAMSMGILEAMASGLPIVATDVGDNASLVNGGSPCGILVPPAAPERLADAIAQIVEHEDRRLRFARSARRRYAERYSVRCMVDNYAMLYRRRS